ncbi:MULTISPECIES: acyl-CoA carboxylase subunit beta [unclassified Nocardioides]|uniref:acyl-CoA carboxylase subunit beta n=1 Tax=unclassified Nocardioides TaxID=2615069 RepID=UPI0006F5482D|nr:MULTISPECIES: acyl-CoA carboxylase subunit beta [unclassified Nocardioides]KQY64749.1 propionyl-CoA carboxylase [Nocardioides sp. Root140]KRF17550.1 propionyl-CoA carboxylase [Nocardioides sp. Soil796]
MTINIETDVLAGTLLEGPMQERRDRLAALPIKEPRDLSARNRAVALCDSGAFNEIMAMRNGYRSEARGATTPLPSDGVAIGWGLIHGRPTAIASHDFAVAGGSIGSVFADKVVRLQRFAIDNGMPIIYINDSGGARIHEGIEALDGCGRIFAQNVRAKKRVPQISVIMGPCAGAAAYSPALTDWTIMVSGQGRLFLTGPEVVKAATGEDVDPEDLGGAGLHTRDSGVAHLEVADEREALRSVIGLLSFLPQQRGGELPLQAPREPERSVQELADLIPAASHVAFDVRHVLSCIVDGGTTFELSAKFSPSVVTGFARLNGVPIGIVASQPRRRGGILDAKAAQKVARFVRFCGRFGVPITTWVDVPGFIPGAVEERRAVITHGADMLDAYADADAPRLTVIMRKAYGGAYIAMGSRSLGADFTWAWPQSEIAVMGPEGAVGILNRRELAAADDPRAVRTALAAQYRAEVTHPFRAVDAGIVDDVIQPEQTRAALTAALQGLGLGLH